VPFLLIPLLVLLAVIALMPLSLVLRYRASKARRLARGWVAVVNVVGAGLSSAFLLLAAAVTSFWVPNAFRSAALGLLAGCLLGLVGLWLSRWETTPRSLHFTPNRWLVLTLMLVVAGRVLYGFWRGFHSWRAALHGTTWIAAAGVAGSLAAGAVVLGYYLTYWAGVWRRFQRHKRTWSVVSP
jgi:hypothetical protein